MTRSNGAQAIECRQFDRISFKWNGKLGASVHIRFNCLSTDFSRIKGVKGIPLRLQIESEQGHLNHHPAMIPQISTAERTYCRIKLFRDKVPFLCFIHCLLTLLTHVFKNRALKERTKMMLNILNVN